MSTYTGVTKYKLLKTARFLAHPVVNK